MDKKILVTLVDKQVLFRVGVRHTLSRQPDFEIFDTSPNENPTVLIEANPPDVVLLDIDYPSLRGLDLARKITLCCPTAKIIMLTSNPDDKQLFEIIKTGAVAYLDKSIAAEELARTVRKVSHGENLIHDSLLARPKAGVAGYLLKDITRVELAQAIRQVYRNSHSLKESDDLVEEAVELVIPPPANAACLLRFMHQLAEILHDGFASIICTVGSWDRGTVITIRPYGTTHSSLIVALANIAEVEKVEEEPLARSAFPHFAKKFSLLPSLGINPSKRIRVTLKESVPAKQFKLASTTS